MSMQNTASVQRHREKNAAEGYARMEVTLGRKFITQAREFARARKIPFWYFVQESLLAYAAAIGKAPESGSGK